MPVSEDRLTWVKVLLTETADLPLTTLDDFVGGVSRAFSRPYTITAAGREQLEPYLETRRAQEDGDECKALRRGWGLGEETFRQELLERVRAGAGEPPRADARRETLEEKARCILREELDALGWDGAALAPRSQGDARKVRIARRRRTETSVTLKWIAEHLQRGPWTHVANRLSQNPAQSVNQPDLNLCQK